MPRVMEAFVECLEVDDCRAQECLAVTCTGADVLYGAAVRVAICCFCHGREDFHHVRRKRFPHYFQ